VRRVNAVIANYTLCQELKRVRLTKTDLDRIPADERFLYCIDGNLVDYVAILSQFMIVASGNALGQLGIFFPDEPHNAAG
jgi:hypothetical protein